MSADGFLGGGVGADDYFRFLAIMVRRYSRDPSTRDISSRHILAAAIGLFSEERGPGEAALAAAETLALLAAVQRRKARAA